ADPWAVRFFDERGKDVPYFVWDAITWRVAREGRPDWGKRFALLNHGPGDAESVREARVRKLQSLQKTLPELATRLQAQEQASAKNPDSLCAVMFLLRHRMAPFGKERLTLRIYTDRQVVPKHQITKGAKVEQRLSVKQGALELKDLPDRLTVF